MAMTLTSLPGKIIRNSGVQSALGFAGSFVLCAATLAGVINHKDVQDKDTRARLETVLGEGSVLGVYSGDVIYRPDLAKGFTRASAELAGEEPTATRNLGDITLRLTPVEPYGPFITRRLVATHDGKSETVRMYSASVFQVMPGVY